MQPSESLIRIETNEDVIQKFISQVILEPRLNVLTWSSITKQSPGLRIGYPAQHLASLITGVEGSRTGARGDDLVDGTEVKSCNRIDQLDTCKDCGQKVSRMEEACSACNSNRIDRKNDSKWLLSIRSETELRLLTEKVGRVLLILLDYPNFAQNEFQVARILAYEIWPAQSPNFVQLCNDYYYKIYLEHIRKNPSKTPAPKNFWPESYQFYLCNPLKVFETEIVDFNTVPKSSIKFYHPSDQSRSDLVAESAPIGIFKSNEIDNIFDEFQAVAPFEPFIQIWKSVRNENDAQKRKVLKLMQTKGLVVPSKLLQKLPLRDTSKASPHEATYLRR